MVDYMHQLIGEWREEKYGDIFEYIDDMSAGINRSEDKDVYEERITSFMADVQKKYEEKVSPYYSSCCHNTNTCCMERKCLLWFGS